MKWTQSQKTAAWLTGSVLIIDTVWLSYSPLYFSALSWILLTGLFVACGIFYESHRRYSFSERTFHLLSNGLLLLSFSVAGLLLSYLVVSQTEPLYDATLVKIDAALGFDWRSYNTFFLSNTCLRVLVLGLYLLVPLLPLLIIIKLIFIDKFEQAANCVLILMSGALACIAIAALIPSAGAVSYWQPAADFYQGHQILINRHYMEGVAALRNGDPVAIQIWQPLAVIAFPSFHACLAAITILLTLRYFRTWFWGTSGINALSLLAIPVEGGHHLLDVLAGMVVGVLIVWVVNKFASAEY